MTRIGPKLRAFHFIPVFGVNAEGSGVMSEMWRGQKLEEFSKIKMTEGVREVSRQDASGTLTPNILFPLHVAAENSFTNFIYFWDSVRKTCLWNI